MTNQFDIKFLGKKFRTTLLFIVFFELLSLTTFLLLNKTGLFNYLTMVIILATFVISLRNIKIGLYIALTELFIGSKGYLFFISIAGFNLSVRIGIFLAVFSAWLIWLIKDQSRFKEITRIAKNNKTFILLGIICIWGIIFALINNNNLSNIVFDFNAWIYFLYLFPFLTVYNSLKFINNLMQVLAAAITAIALKSLIFLYIFSHTRFLSQLIYKWGRDTGWGEFTAITESLYRIFSQAQIYALIGFFIIMGYLIFKGRLNYRHTINQYLFIILFSLLTIIILSLSRSFWLALIVTFIILILIGIIFYKYRTKQVLSILLRLGFLFLLSYALIVFIINFPYPKTDKISDASTMISSRLIMNESAVSSRWSQLPHLTTAIAQHPIIGSGWGTTVTYQSQDPRILTEENPEGWYTTYAFEWGYLDIVLKIGLFGLIIYLIIIWQQFKISWQLFKKNTDPYYRSILIGLILGLVALLITHGFSPYLNHPLGIGYIIIIFTCLKILKQNQINIEPTKS